MSAKKYVETLFEQPVTLKVARRVWSFPPMQLSSIKAALSSAAHPFNQWTEMTVALRSSGGGNRSTATAWSSPAPATNTPATTSPWFSPASPSRCKHGSIRWRTRIWARVDADFWRRVSFCSFWSSDFRRLQGRVNAELRTKYATPIFGAIRNFCITSVIATEALFFHSEGPKSVGLIL